MNGPVLQVSTATGWRGGEQQALYLATGLREGGVASIFATPLGSPLAMRAKEAGFTVEALGAGPAWWPPRAWHLKRMARRLGAALLHAHDSR